eukprot:TRINITY_DN2636_c2_g1_i1.p1 TRINITY_DN2636_c2_g1~~TRINITY_DN2636_c2_g1_i1.p1  ORF type:complete len:553 (-),score=254.25 TRINITY_DN2636_c2_g1_i1:76-1734(-)
MAKIERNEDWGPPEIDPREIVQGECLGSGSFGAVYKGTCRQHEVAIKVLFNQDYALETIETFKREIEIMSKLNHPHIVLYMGACTVSGNLKIVTELLPNGDVERLLAKHQVKLSLCFRMKMALEAALGVNWLHRSNPPIIHRDLKTSNLLLDENYHVKICDFGLSQVKNTTHIEDQEGAKGTPLWMAPEVLTGKPFNEKADVYSFGIILWELLTRQEPFLEFEDLYTFRQAVCNNHVRPIIPADTNPALKNLIQCCWSPDVSRRPQFDEIIRSLETVFVSVAVNDETAGIFWKKNFSHKYDVHWQDFANALVEFMHSIPPHCLPLPDEPNVNQIQTATNLQLQQFQQRSIRAAQIVEQELMRRQMITSDSSEFDVINQKMLRCIQIVLTLKEKSQHSGIVAPDNARVNLEDFGRLLDFFGPLVNPINNSFELGKQLIDVIPQQWFFGDFATDVAEQTLSKMSIGTFLIRLSSSQAGNFTISKQGIDGVTHQRITKRGGLFYVNNKCFQSLSQLVLGMKNELQLLCPCPGSPFAVFFAVQTQFRPTHAYLQNS